MNNLKGKNIIGTHTMDDLLKLGIQSISTISEATWKPRIIFKYLDGTEKSFSGGKKNTIIDEINNEINEMIKRKLIEQRKEKLKQLKQ